MKTFHLFGDGFGGGGRGLVILRELNCFGLLVTFLFNFYSFGSRLYGPHRVTTFALTFALFERTTSAPRGTLPSSRTLSATPAAFARLSLIAWYWQERRGGTQAGALGRKGDKGTAAETAP